MSNTSEQTSLFGRLFPRPPSDKELKARGAANRRTVVGRVSTGSYLLQTGRYFTEEDIAERRRLLLQNK